MTGVLILPSAAPAGWIGNVLPGTAPTMLPLAGRRFVDHAIETARRRGSPRTVVADWELFSPQLAQELGDETRPGGTVPYLHAEGAQPEGLDGLASAGGPVAEELRDGVIVEWGLSVQTGRAARGTFRPCTPEETARTPQGLYLFEGGRWSRCETGNIPLAGVKEWFDANFAVLGRPDLFSMPGYTSEKDVHIGINVVMERGTTAVPPLLMLDKAWCARNVKLDGNVIIGRESFVGEGTRLKNTIICDDTYVGQDMELEGKIVSGRRIIDARDGTWVDVENPNIARSGTELSGGRMTRFLRKLAGILHGASRGRRS